MQPVLDWFVDHELALWTIASIIVLPLLRARTPEDWINLGERHPRIQGAIRFLRGVGVDPVKVLSGLVQMLTGRLRAAAKIENLPGPIKSEPPPPDTPKGDS